MGNNPTPGIPTGPPWYPDYKPGYVPSAGGGGSGYPGDGGSDYTPPWQPPPHEDLGPAEPPEGPVYDPPSVFDPAFFERQLKNDGPPTPGQVGYWVNGSDLWNRDYVRWLNDKFQIAPSWRQLTYSNYKAWYDKYNSSVVPYQSSTSLFPRRVRQYRRKPKKFYW